MFVEDKILIIPYIIYKYTMDLHMPSKITI